MTDSETQATTAHGRKAVGRRDAGKTGRSRAKAPVGTPVKAAAAALVDPAPVEATPPIAAIETPVAETQPDLAAPIMAAAAEIPAPAQAPFPTPSDPRTQDADMDTIDTITDKTKAFFSGLNTHGAGDLGEQAKGAFEKSAKMVEEMTAFGKGNIEAIVESSKIAAKSVETLGQDAADYAKTSFESATAAAKTLAAAKSPTEFFKLQSDYARTAFDSLIAEGSRSTERMLKIYGEIAQPISNRVAVATDKLKISA